MKFDFGVLSMKSNFEIDGHHFFQMFTFKIREDEGATKLPFVSFDLPILVSHEFLFFSLCLVHCIVFFKKRGF